MLQQNTAPVNQTQTIYIGIDVHLKNWNVTFRSGGLHLGTHNMEPDADKLFCHLKKNYPNFAYKSVYEAGFCGFWIHRKLTSLGIENIVINAADIPSMGKEKSYKTDVVDSKKLARELENGSLVDIYIPSEADESFRSLNRLRHQYIRDIVRQKNRIKSMVHRLGIPLPANHEMSHWSRRFIEHLRKLPFESEVDRIVMDQLIDILLKIRSATVVIVQKLRKLVEDDKATAKTVAHLMSVPGVGVITAMTLKSELIDIRRFKHLNELSSYIGLVPAVYSSGEKEITMGMSNRHLPYLRNMLIESSWTAVKKDPALLECYNTLSKRMTKTEAIVRICKKLLNRIMTVWKNQTDYVCAVVS